LFLSLHFNSADGPAVGGERRGDVLHEPVRASSTNARGEGAGAGAYPGNRLDAKNMLLAYQLQKAITEKSGAEDRGVKRARFWVCATPRCPPL